MKASKKFGMMSNEQFADYLYNNPGGASKAFLLRCEGVSTEQPKVEVRTEWKTKVEYKERVVEKVVERVIEKEVEKIKVPLWMRRVTGISALVAIGCMVMMPTGVVKEVVRKERVEVPVSVVKEVPGPERVVEVVKEVEVVREVPVEVIREVEVVVANEYTENQLRGEVARLTNYIHQLHGQMANRSNQRTSSFIGGVLSEVLR